ncbi:hypothetical protein [Pandoraea apista]|uniref:hypothetical protein n=1 Tax=Pandoraea apista TaxID=93218 RepID=UPI000659004F|nr:hypothetical protein [Pandoraea apista]ALS68417.1 hypothetical protein AT395_25075 [Pandoraea apista]CFB60443.1 hypothetical protein LMG16407_00482 [Pandoraea apista]
MKSNSRHQREIDLFESILSGEDYTAAASRLGVPVGKVRQVTWEVLRAVWARIEPHERPAALKPYTGLPTAPVIRAHAGILAPAITMLRAGQRRQIKPALAVPAPVLDDVARQLAAAEIGTLDVEVVHARCAIPVFLSLLHGTSLTDTAERIGQSKQVARELAKRAVCELIGVEQARAYGWKAVDSSRLVGLRGEFVAALEVRGWWIDGTSWRRAGDDQ